MKNQDDIRRLFSDYLAGQATEQEAEELLRFLQLHEDEDFIGSLIAGHFDHPAVASLLDNAQVRQRLEQSHNAITRHISQQHKARIRKIYWLSGAVAAAILVAVFFLPFLWKVEPARMLTIVVPNGQTRQVLLPDSTQVWLSAGTTFQYPDRFSKEERIVTLQNGEGYFEVRRDPSHPFKVMGKLHVTVLGTAFDIRSFEGDREATVTVATGKVRVETRDQQATLIPGQQSVLDNASGKMTTARVSPQDALGLREGHLNFMAAPFTDVMTALERKYQVRIKIEKQSLLQERITLRLENDPIENVLNALGLSNNFKYRNANDSVIIIH